MGWSLVVTCECECGCDYSSYYNPLLTHALPDARMDGWKAELSVFNLCPTCVSVGCNGDNDSEDDEEE